MQSKKKKKKVASSTKEEKEHPFLEHDLSSPSSEEDT